jgi:MarR family transcriptional regulator for hemolysin
MDKLDEVIFYTIDRAIKTYRQYAQGQLKKAGYSITIDQWLVIKNLLEIPDISQQELGQRVFKDNASVTRIIALLVKKQYLKKINHKTDGRRSTIEVTGKGKKVIDEIWVIVQRNRKTALQNITEKEIGQVRRTLTAIINNCK